MKNADLQIDCPPNSNVQNIRYEGQIKGLLNFSLCITCHSLIYYADELPMKVIFAMLSCICIHQYPVAHYLRLQNRSQLFSCFLAAN
jgi:hypothetical protein